MLEEQSHAFGAVDVVFDDQDAAGLALRRGGFRFRGRCLGGFIEKQLHAKLRAVAESFAADAHRAAGHLAQSLDERQTGPKAAATAIKRTISLREGVENRAERFAIHADA